MTNATTSETTGINGYWTSSKNACEFYGITGNTIRRWAQNNKITYKRTPSNQRVYFIPTNNNKQVTNYTPLQVKQNYIYCRVSSSKQKDDLDRQCKFMSDRYPNHIIIKDIGSGLNYKRKGLIKLMELSNQNRINEIIVSSKDRLCRFGFELLQWQFLQNNTKILVLDQSNKTTEEQFTEDILAILQVFACRWNGKRSYTNTNSKNAKNKTQIEFNSKENIQDVV